VAQRLTDEAPPDQERARGVFVVSDNSPRRQTRPFTAGARSSPSSYASAVTYVGMSVCVSLLMTGKRKVLTHSWGA